jgi:hypothetical protein
VRYQLRHIPVARHATGVDLRLAGNSGRDLTVLAQQDTVLATVSV